MLLLHETQRGSDETSGLLLDPTQIEAIEFDKLDTAFGCLIRTQERAYQVCEAPIDIARMRHAHANYLKGWGVPPVYVTCEPSEADPSKFEVLVIDWRQAEALYGPDRPVRETPR